MMITSFLVYIKTIGYETRFTARTIFTQWIDWKNSARIDQLDKEVYDCDDTTQRGANVKWNRQTRSWH